MKPELLIIDKEQFGYLTDAYKWCEYLRNEYNITFVTLDQKRTKIELDGIKIHYVTSNFPKLIRAFLYILVCWFYILKSAGFVFVVYFSGCSIFKFLSPWKRMHVDVRTLAVFDDDNQRLTYDKRLKSECKKFDSVSAITSGVAELMKIDGIKILPLGSDVISTNKKNYIDSVRLLYVGTLRYRKIEKTLYGLKLFVSKYSDISIHYDIVGDGFPGELNKLKQITSELDLNSYVTFHGFVPITRVKPFFDNCNVGVCFVPITSFYQYQPPTKTFEYILSGLYCIGTATKINMELINSQNGVLIDDSPEGFCGGIEKFIENRNQIDEVILRQTLSGSLWKNVVDNYLKPILK